MKFHISLAFTNTFRVTNGTGLCDDTQMYIKHWKLVIASSTRARIIELTTLDQKTILIKDTDIERYLYDEEPMLKKFQVARYDGCEDDFNQVLRHHPVRGGRYSPTFNNCQHFVANFLILLRALANRDGRKSFEANENYEKIFNRVISSDKTFIWNEPNFYLALVRHGMPVALYPAMLVADAASAATVTYTTTVPATGIMGWLGAAPTVTTVTTAAPYAAAAGAAATTLSFIILAGGIGSAALHYQCYSWKCRMKIKNPLVSGFPVEPV